MPLLYLDCQYGIAGDMALSALIDAGADINYVISHLNGLPVDPFVLGVSTVNQHGIQAKTLQLFFPLADTGPTPLSAPGRHLHHRRASAILAMIESSSLPLRVKQRATAVFSALARAEGKIHGIPPDEVHFHEVGAMDSIIDIIGVCLALESLDIDRIIASPVAVGGGKKQMAHGCYPIPAPATAELLLGIPLADFPVEGELTTPTGAAFINALVHEFRALPAVTLSAIGYGAGKKRFSHPNILRVMVCESAESRPERETVVTLQCEMDDISGENLGYVMERLFEQQALDVYYTPVYMKKNRPGTLVTVLCRPEDSAMLEEILLLETSTFGVRQTRHSRLILQRRIEYVTTPYGDIAVKIGFRGQRVYHTAPEYEQVRLAAKNHRVPFDLVWGTVRQSANADWAAACLKTSQVVTDSATKI
ncbi:nickel pincer cofactor biosynthesis protein LarC [Sodalis sp. dw_96]|uniref:nickel pincer cofactor biosynthesis protein LarC n=1 Tax=Sodalis sp. dw_96 TaxID=2719794 RepID=UPI001BD5B089|nr:nickel pincer cofactor biosynthesis protein LarC [Sodalis sp. dw_96]